MPLREVMLPLISAFPSAILGAIKGPAPPDIQQHDGDYSPHSTSLRRRHLTLRGAHSGEAPARFMPQTHHERSVFHRSRIPESAAFEAVARGAQSNIDA